MIDLTKCDAIVFDFDGVLVESVDIKTRAFGRLFESHGSEIVEKVIAHHRNNGGVSRFEKFRHYYRAFLGQPLSETEMQGLARRFADLVVEEVAAAPFIPGAERFLAECSTRVPCFVVSGTPEDELRDIVRRRRMTEYFVEVLGAPVSKTENVTRIIETHRFAPARMTFFGDAEADWIAANETGVEFVGLVRDRDNPLHARSGFRKIADFDELRLDRARA